MRALPKDLPDTAAHLLTGDRDDLGPDIAWGGPDVGGRQARLDAAFAAYEKRHTGADRGAHHRPPRRDPWDQLMSNLDDLAALEEYGRSIGIPIAGVGHEPGDPS